MCYRVPTAQGKQGKWQKNPVREKTGNLEMLPKDRKNTKNLVCSSCKFPDSQGKGYFKICRKDFQFLGEVRWISLPSQFCVCNSHKSHNLKFEKTGKTGNLKMQFEWVPCISF